jgi:hypothetical protein
MVIMLIQNNSFPDYDPRRPDTNSEEVNFWRERCCQLERTNAELRSIASDLYERAERETFCREGLEASVNQHKEALIEKVGELGERDRTIKTQTFLLEFAWEDAQNLVSLQGEKDDIISELRGAASDTGGNAATEPNKKRKLSA